MRRGRYRPCFDQTFVKSLLARPIHCHNFHISARNPVPHQNRKYWRGLVQIAKKKIAVNQEIVTKHELAQVHSKLNEKEKKEILARYNATIKELPKIFTSDPAVSHLDIKQGDVVKITRNSRTCGKTDFYRGVIDG